MLTRNSKRENYSSPKALPSGDLWTYRMVVMTLALTVIGCIVGTILLQVYGKPTPELLTALGTGAIGALAGILAPPPSRS
ncbi:hypothetical protein [Leptolyngbya sp. AN02str]|uniref:hypothetical protein n=1 Tax=Leptolyngbya sp. AN02str TaxID=3423363 RepID=UPI003D3172C7